MLCAAAIMASGIAVYAYQATQDARREAWRAQQAAVRIERRDALQEARDCRIRVQRTQDVRDATIVAAVSLARSIGIDEATIDRARPSLETDVIEALPPAGLLNLFTADAPPPSLGRGHLRVLSPAGSK